MDIKDLRVASQGFGSGSGCSLQRRKKAVATLV